MTSGLTRVRQERQRQVVEAALHVERRREAAPVHPEHAEARVVGHELARADAEDVLRRERNPDDLEVAAAAVDDRADAIARIDAAGEGERLR